MTVINIKGYRKRNMRGDKRRIIFITAFITAFYKDCMERRVYIYIFSILTQLPREKQVVQADNMAANTICCQIQCCVDIGPSLQTMTRH